MNPTFIWYELMTPDAEAAIEFYGKVAGWTAAQHPSAQSAENPYLVLSIDGRGVGGVLQQNKEMLANGMPPMWAGYIGVPDTDEAAERIKTAGGSVHMGPADIPDVGRFAMVADPGGALFYVMTPNPREDEPPPPDPFAIGGCGWHELIAGGGQAAAFEFYAGQFGWETVREMDMGPMGVYRVFGANGSDLGGMMDKPAEMPRAAWGYYFNVDGIDAAAERVTAHGGTVRMGPIEVPNGGWIVQGADPQGAVFALFSKTR